MFKKIIILIAMFLSFNQIKAADIEIENGDFDTETDLLPSELIKKLNS